MSSENGNVKQVAPPSYVSDNHPIKVPILSPVLLYELYAGDSFGGALNPKSESPNPQESVWSTNDPKEKG